MQKIKNILKENKTQITWFVIGVATVIVLSHACRMLTWGNSSYGHDRKNMKSEMGKMMNRNNEEGGMDHSNMNNVMMGMTDNLKNKSGDDLEKTFLIEMISHHSGAVDMAKIIIASSTNVNLKRFANEIINAQTKEIASMRLWLSEYK